MSDIDDIEEKGGTVDLLALLYPDDEASETSDHEGSTSSENDGEMGEELSGEFDELLGLRSLFGAMPEEEPSDAISNQLLAFAATHAPKPAQAKGGLWAWFSDLIMPLATHPGLAAAASLVLIAGVAGTLYYKNGGQAAEPMAESAAKAPITTPSPGNSAGEGRPEESPADPAAAAPEKGKSELDENADRGLEPTSLEVSVGRASDRPAPAEDTSNEKIRGKKQDLSRRAKTKPATEGSQGEIISEKATGAETERKRVAKDRVQDRLIQVPKKNKRAPAKSTPSPSRSTVKSSPKKPAAPGSKSLSDGLGVDFSDSEESPDDDSSPDTKMVPTTKVSSLHSQAKIAAKKGDCAAVTRLGRQVQKLDSAYYRQQFLADASLKACRAGSKPSK